MSVHLASDHDQMGMGDLQKNKVNSNTFYLLDTFALEDIVREVQLVRVSDGMSELYQCQGFRHTRPKRKEA